jgi:hypothetical protein
VKRQCKEEGGKGDMFDAAHTHLLPLDLCEGGRGAGKRPQGAFTYSLSSCQGSTCMCTAAAGRSPEAAEVRAPPAEVEAGLRTWTQGERMGRT